MFNVFLPFISRLTVCLSLLTLAACSSGKKERIEDGIDTALYYLSLPTPDCQKAIEELEKIGRQDTNALYLRTLASAYACRGGFSELSLFGDISKISSNAASFFGSVTTLTMATQTAAEPDSFLDVERALNILLYAGGQTKPSYTNLLTIFGQRHANNLSMQTLFMLLTQLGRYNYYYGNVNSAGKKGLRSGGTGNKCFLSYPGAIQAIADEVDLVMCNTTNAPLSGHPQLSTSTPGITAAIVNRRLCQGVVIVNNLIDILTNIEFSNNDALGAVVDLKTTLNTLLTEAQSIPDPNFQAFLEVNSQKECEDILNADNQVGLTYFAAIFEGGLL